MLDAICVGNTGFNIGENDWKIVISNNAYSVLADGKMIAESVINKDEEITTNYREVLKFRLKEGLL